VTDEEHELRRCVTSAIRGDNDERLERRVLTGIWNWEEAAG